MTSKLRLATAHTLRVPNGSRKSKLKVVLRHHYRVSSAVYKRLCIKDGMYRVTGYVPADSRGKFWETGVKFMYAGRVACGAMLSK